LVKLGILKDTSVIDDVLSLEVKDILERRLQTIVMRKGLARTMAQSRQLITHGYISVNSRTVNRPNHTITLEDNVGYAKQIDISVKTAEPTAAPATPSAAPASTEKVATS
jgi:small subunit ribosomal protein S4